MMMKALVFVLTLLSVHAFEWTAKMHEFDEAMHLFRTAGQAMRGIGNVSQRRTETRRMGAEEAAEAAIAAAELAVDYLGDLTTNIVNDAESARDEVREWRRAIENVSEEDLTEFVRKVAESSVLLNNADTDSRIIMADILEMTQLTIEELELNMGDTEAFKVAIQDAQLIFAVALEGAAESIGDLKLKVSQAQVEFRVVADLSLNIQTRINDNMHDRDAWLEARKASLRAKAYGGCAACIACTMAAPVCCSVCYATAAGIVETKIKELEADVAASKTALTNLVARFGDIAEKADNLSYISEQTYEQMGLTERQLTTTANLAVKSDRVSLWKGVLLRKFKALVTFLEEKIAWKAEQTRPQAI